MEKRVSCRDFSELPLEKSTVDTIANACKSLTTTPFGDRMAFGLLEQHIEGRVKIGTYGTVKNPAAFVYGFSQLGPLAYCGYGYLMEQIILLATELGLSSCWLGFYRRRPLQRSLAPPKGYVIPAVGVIGYASKKTSTYGTLAARVSADRRRKKPTQLFFDGAFDTPLDLSGSGALEHALAMLRLAPSSGNLQPWRLIVERGSRRGGRRGGQRVDRNGGRRGAAAGKRSEDGRAPRQGQDGAIVHFYVDLSESYGGLIRKSLKWIDMGICMCHFDLALIENELPGEWLIDDPRLETGNDKVVYVASRSFSGGLQETAAVDSENQGGH
jgi:nitroreductase